MVTMFAQGKIGDLSDERDVVRARISALTELHNEGSKHSGVILDIIHEMIEKEFEITTRIKEIIES